MDKIKYLCECCNWHGLEKDLLKAPHPFREREILFGCPNCLMMAGLKWACDEPDCWLPVTCGTPTDKEYRHTCGKHMRDLLRSAKS